VIDHVARELFTPPPEPAAEKNEHPKPTTDTGLSVEEQVRKEWGAEQRRAADISGLTVMPLTTVHIRHIFGAI